MVRSICVGERPRNSDRSMVIHHAQPTTCRSLGVSNPSEIGSSGTRQSSKRTASLDVAVVSSLGALLSIGLVISLATNGELAEGEAVTETFEIMSENIMEAVLPSTATDLMSITLGEALAGVIGAASTFVLSLFVNKERPGRRTVGKDAVADGDFLVASAAAFPLVEALGLSPILSSVLISVFAIIPYELVKYGSRIRERRRQEDELLQQLLNEERSRKQQSTWTIFPSKFVEYDSNDKETSPNKIEATDTRLDLVEILTDLIRWLEYGILMTDFGGKLSLLPGVESAIYGVLATFSSQAYGDLFYGVFGFGGPLKRDLVRNRTASDWTTYYVSRALYAAT